VKQIDYLCLLYVINYRIDLCFLFKPLASPSFVSFVFGVCYFLSWSLDWCEQLKILQLALCRKEEEMLHI